MSNSTFHKLLELLTHPFIYILPPAALCRLAHGTPYATVARWFGLDSPEAARLVVGQAVCENMSMVVEFWKEAERTQMGFRWVSLPNCCGVLGFQRFGFENRELGGTSGSFLVQAVVDTDGSRVSPLPSVIVMGCVLHNFLINAKEPFPEECQELGGLQQREQFPVYKAVVNEKAKWTRDKLARHLGWQGVLRENGWETTEKKFAMEDADSDVIEISPLSLPPSHFARNRKREQGNGKATKDVNVVNLVEDKEINLKFQAYHDICEGLRVENMDLLRAVILGADRTPYHDGLFCFQVLRRYVYMALLGTWTTFNKAENWQPGVSNVMQHFEDLVRGHFHSRAKDIMVACRAYMSDARVGCVTKKKRKKGGIRDLEEGSQLARVQEGLSCTKGNAGASFHRTWSKKPMKVQ
ncbi:unnamed protein product [Linum tenue]|uniref:Transposase n=1 Tax=Linum tenue TaxID=586396 RepID=A0AAV0HVE1_9ROSI|nr:unnamed protein product [Linum tenue]